MLRRLHVRGFKSLADVELTLPRFTVLFGPNASGKSNILDALLVLSRLATERTLADAFGGPVRGYPVECFRFPEGGLPALIEQENASTVLEADLQGEGKGERLRYRVGVTIQTRSGALSLSDEYLTGLDALGAPEGTAAIEVVEGQIHVRRKRRGRPPYELLGRNHTMLSDARLSGTEYKSIETARNELSSFRTYYLDPRVAMRQAIPPKEVQDIGLLGEDLARFLHRLRNSPGGKKCFDQVVRTLHSIIPSVQSVSVDLDEKRGTLDTTIVQNGVPYSSRIASEGTLRVLALAALVVNPWPGALVAFEEPENGVHPRRLELIAQMLGALAIDRGRQLIVTTHSPLFAQQVLNLQRKHPEDVALFTVRQEGRETRCAPFDATGPLFDDAEVRASNPSWLRGRRGEGMGEP